MASVPALLSIPVPLLPIRLSMIWRRETEGEREGGREGGGGGESGGVIRWYDYNQ